MNKLKTSNCFKLYILIQHLSLLVTVLLTMLVFLFFYSFNYYLYSFLILVLSIIDYFASLMRINTISISLKDKYIYISKGVIFKKIEIIPLDQIYVVDKYENPILKTLNISKIDIKTLGYHVVIIGLNEKDSYDLLMRIQKGSRHL